MGGAALGVRLQRPTGGQHHGNHGASQVLTHHQRTDQCQHRDHIDANLPAPQRPGHPDHTWYQSAAGRHDPQQIGRTTLANEPQPGTCERNCPDPAQQAPIPPHPLALRWIPTGRRRGTARRSLIALAHRINSG